MPAGASAPHRCGPLPRWLRALPPRTGGLPPGWGALADRHAADPFSRPEWIRAWGDTIGSEPVVVTIRRDRRLVAAYPMVVGSGTALRSAADRHVPHLDIVGDAAGMGVLVGGGLGGG